MVDGSDAGKSPAPKSQQHGFEITFEPVYLPKDEDDARIKRLSKQILACIERSRQERRRAKKPEREGDDIFRKDFDEIFGLSS